MKPTKNSKLFAAFLIAASVFLLQARPAFNPGPYYAPEKSVEIQGAKMIYLDQGSGKVILLIHGYCGNAYNWSAVFNDLSKDYRVIVPDLPGYGKSGCPQKTEKQMMLWYADLMAEFLDKLGVQKAVVVGNSMGGSIAAWMAVRHPEKVEKLVLEDSAGIKGSKMDLLKGLASITPSNMLIPMLHLIFPVNEQALDKGPKSEKERVKLAELRYKSDLAKCSSKAMKWSAFSIGKDLTENELAKISMPTLIIWGSNDDLLDVSTAEKFHQKVPGSKVEIIQGGVHTPMQWKPEEFVQVLKAFVSAK
jgi:pimeloyl-ACP methyl ester carboxylesterase